MQWTAFFAWCLIKFRSGEHVSPQYGGVWTLESSSLVHFPTTIIALNRTVRDGASYANNLIPILEEWFAERDWHIVNHWEDQFCREMYEDLCNFDEMQHLRAIAMALLGTTPSVCPVAHDGITLGSLDPLCAEIRSHP